MDAARDLFSYRKYWASRLTPAPVLPMSRAEMDVLGWDACDVLLVTGRHAGEAWVQLDRGERELAHGVER